MEKNRKFPKEMLDELIESVRDEWRSYRDHVDTIALALSAEDRIGANWLYIANLLMAILSPSGFRPEATNEEIYEVLRVLGWEVV